MSEKLSFDEFKKKYQYKRSDEVIAYELYLIIKKLEEIEFGYMSGKRFRKVMGFIQDNTCEKGDMDGVMDLAEIEDMLNEQQDIISALKDIFKDIVTYSEWDSKKPYCSLGIGVDRKTYYKIREILNE